jgi:spore coat protein A, manganese oxidase
MFTRRQFLKISTTAGAGMLLSSRLPFPRRAYAAIPGGSLDPILIPKYVMPLVIPPAMPRTGKIKIRGGKNADYYEIAVRQFRQHILPPTLGVAPSKVWGYGSVSDPASFNFPAFTIEAKWRSPVRVKWINELKDSNGKFLPHLFAVDQTLHWANPPGGLSGRDSRPSFSTTPDPYTGPVPIVTHLHGTVGVGEESDGYPEAWYLPSDSNIPAGYSREGSWYEQFKGEAAEKFGVAWQPGTATFQYPNDQRATALWYHDHTLGMTRLNVYAGPAGFYLLRGGPDDQVLDSRRGAPAMLPGPAPALGDAPGVKYYEIPLAIQDRSFNDDGSLFYPDSRSFFDEYGGPYVPYTDLSPVWNPEFFGNTMAVNGRTWPFLEVEQRRYRFRVLNGCNSRFLLLKFDSGPSFWQIGTEGGFLPTPVEMNQLLMAPAERLVRANVE